MKPARQPEPEPLALFGQRASRRDADLVEAEPPRFQLDFFSKCLRHQAHFKSVCASRPQSVCSDLAEASTMKCPVCKTEELDFSSLESNLTSRHCDKCGGNWIPSFEYWKWREQHKESLPERTAEQTIPPNPVTSALIAKLCPECNKILIKYRVGHGASFSIDQCRNCG